MTLIWDTVNNSVLYNYGEDFSIICHQRAASSLCCWQNSSSHFRLNVQIRFWGPLIKSNTTMWFIQKKLKNHPLYQTTDFKWVWWQRMQPHHPVVTIPYVLLWFLLRRWWLRQSCHRFPLPEKPSSNVNGLRAMAIVDRRVLAYMNFFNARN